MVGRAYRLTKKAGRYRRLWLGFPLKPDQEELERLIAKAAELPGFKPAPASGLHVTVLHIGPLDALLEELRLAGVRVKQEGLHRALEALLDQWYRLPSPDDPEAQPLPDGPEALPVQGFELLGGQRALVLRLGADRQLDALRKRLWDDLLTMLYRLGVAEPAEFAAGSPLLRSGSPEHCRDHLTLGHLTAEEPARLPLIDQASDLNIRFGLLEVHGAERTV